MLRRGAAPQQPTVCVRQGKLDEAEKALRDSLARVRSNGWALAGLAEVYKRKGNAKEEALARQAYARAWLGGAAPDIARLQAVQSIPGVAASVSVPSALRDCPHAHRTG